MYLNWHSSSWIRIFTGSLPTSQPSVLYLHGISHLSIWSPRKLPTLWKSGVLQFSQATFFSLLSSLWKIGAFQIVISQKLHVTCDFQTLLNVSILLWMSISKKFKEKLWKPETTWQWPSWPENSQTQMPRGQGYIVIYRYSQKAPSLALFLTYATFQNKNISVWSENVTMTNYLAP